MGSILDKFLEATRHMVDGMVSRLPALALAIVVFIAFYALSHVIARGVMNALAKRRRNLGVVFSRLIGGATVMLGILVALSIVAPSFQASDLIKILGIGGVAIGLVFQNILQNFLAGLVMLL